MFLIAVVAASSLVIASASAAIDHYGDDDYGVGHCQDYSYARDSATDWDVSHGLIHEAFSCDNLNHPFTEHIENSTELYNCVHLDFDTDFTESNIRQFRVQYNGDTSRESLEATYASIYKAITDECDPKDVIISLYSFAPMPHKDLRDKLMPEDVVIKYFYDPNAIYNADRNGVYVTVFKEKDVDLPSTFLQLLQSNAKGHIPLQQSSNTEPRLTVHGNDNKCLLRTTRDSAVIPCLGE